jgi:hypothetical protein
MHHARIITVMLAVPTTLWADDMTTPGETPSAPPFYKILRLDEDDSWLSNAARRGDWFEPVNSVSTTPSFLF